MQLVDESLGHDDIVLHAMHLLCDFGLLFLVVINRVIIVLHLLGLILQIFYRLHPLLHDYPIHFFGLGLAFTFLLVAVDLDDERLRQKIEAVDHEYLYLSKIVIEIGHPQILKIALHVLEGLLNHLDHVAKVENQLCVRLR